MRLGRSSASRRELAVRSSRRKPHIPPSEPGQMATVLVALAVTEFKPSQIRVGKEIRVPPPATELMAPAAKAAAKATAAWSRLNEDIEGQKTRRLRRARVKLAVSAMAMTAMTPAWTGSVTTRSAASGAEHARVQHTA